MSGRKVAVITGASRGIGREVAIYFSKQDYHVVLIARSKDQLEALKQYIDNELTLSQRYREEDMCSFYNITITSEQHVKAVIEGVIQKHGRIDVLYNNAGVVYEGTSQLSARNFEHMLAVNVLGGFYITQCVVLQMKKQRSGYIFNISSLSGKRATDRLGGYAASKFALVGFNDALYRELLPFGIKVTALCPGFVDTDMSIGVRVNADQMIKTEDIVLTTDYLLNLGENVCIKEIVIQCRAQPMPW